MRLLIITQKVDINDDNLGFFHGWIEKFSEKLEKVYVVCLTKDDYNLPSNVSVYSMGKEKGTSKIGQFFRLQKHLTQVLPGVDGVFVHMCPIYVMASFPLVKIFRKKIVLWYAHAGASLLVKIAEKLVSNILTPSKDSFVHKGKKVIVTGHGIDVGLFKPGYNVNTTNEKTILSAGRIAPVKDLETLVRAIDILVNQKNLKNIRARVIGSALEDYEKKHLEHLKSLIKEKRLQDYIEFSGGVPNREMTGAYQESDIFVNMQAEGGAGKAVLEAMACGTPVVLCTSTFNDLLSNFKDEVIFEEKNSKDFAEKLLNCLNFSKEKKSAYSNLLRNIVINNHNLDNLIEKIIYEFKI